MNKLLSIIFVITTLCTSHFAIAGKGIYQTPQVFINNALGDDPQAKTIWLNKEDKQHVADILQHKFNRMRIRYWQLNNETVWILNEIGKEKPITIGVHIVDKKIRHLKVLTFRESRGEEIRHDFFVQQFINAELEQGGQLNQDVDGITGATLSVRATKKVARLALWLHSKVIN